MDIEIIKNIVNQIIIDDKKEYKRTIPLFSFEGLPGAGKTTQIIKASKDLECFLGKSYYIDLPTKSSIGLLLRALYSNQSIWDQISKEYPWINPVLLSMDLRIAIEKAQDENSKYILMSRGILSTYYYNINIFMTQYNDFEKSWNTLNKLLKGFDFPDAIFFLKLHPKIAHSRVIKRNRTPLRNMDLISQMTTDLVLFEKIIERFDHIIPIHYIDGAMPENKVTDNIYKILKNYLVNKND